MKITKALCAAALLFIAPLSFAGKVVVFDPQQAIMQTDAAKKRMQDLQKKPEYSKMVAEAEGLKADLEALAKEAESKGLTWSDEQKLEHRKQIEFVQADFQLVVQKIQKENDDLLKGLLAQGQQQLPGILEALVKAEDIDIILRKDTTIVSMPAADITGKVIAELNKAQAK
ncbi:OmpH family outer membrane protein [Agaribacterium haliotis]|uniref:OmpH family outer membrane protein n=1 Tax=Agaribacterium haliotis TaxID=2013869 RepID=UPI000BB55CEE|nr:OmpH family outer membrane protein [Agaribacterium haliotis]